MSQEPKVTMRVSTIEFVQDGDTCGSDNIQVLTVNQVDGGYGPYWILSTPRWAADSMDELIALLRRAENAREVENAEAH